MGAGGRNMRLMIEFQVWRIVLHMVNNVKVMGLLKRF